MSLIDLDRRFLRWSEIESTGAVGSTWLRQYARTGLDWPKSLQHRRVVLLAGGRIPEHACGAVLAFRG